MTGSVLNVYYLKEHPAAVKLHKKVIVYSLYPTGPSGLKTWNIRFPCKDILSCIKQHVPINPIDYVQDGFENATSLGGFDASLIVSGLVLFNVPLEVLKQQPPRCLWVFRERVMEGGTWITTPEILSMSLFVSHFDDAPNSCEGKWFQLLRMKLL